MVLVSRGGYRPWTCPDPRRTTLTPTEGHPHHRPTPTTRTSTHRTTPILTTCHRRRPFSLLVTTRVVSPDRVSGLVSLVRVLSGISRTPHPTRRLPMTPHLLLCYRTPTDGLQSYAPNETSYPRLWPTALSLSSPTVSAVDPSTGGRSVTHVSWRTRRSVSGITKL